MSELTDELIADARERMSKSVDSTRGEFGSVRTGRAIAEEGRVAIRNVRRDCMHDLRELRDEGDVGADDEHRAEVELQKLTDEKIAELESLLKGKEAEILEV